MKHTFRLAAVAALVAASAVALPTAAHADPVIYPPSNACSLDAAITPGSTVDFGCSNSTFGPNEFVAITVEGNTSVDIGLLKFAVTSTGSTTSNATGEISVSLTFPSNASGNYNISAVSATSAGGVATASVVTPAGGSGGSNAGGLPATGIDSSSLLGLWVGGGALVLAGGAIAVATAVRRNRKEHAGV